MSDVQELVNAIYFYFDGKNHQSNYRSISDGAISIENHQEKIVS